MGVKNIMKLLKKYSPNSLHITHINDYSNKRIGIDFNLMIYKMIYAIRKHGKDIKNNTHIVTHIHALLLKLKAFKKYNITPVFVLDAKPSKLKNNTILDRKLKIKQNSLLYKNALPEDRKKYFYMSNDITQKEIDDCEELVKIFGYTVIHAKEEADSQLVYLLHDGKIDFIASDDLDICVFGANCILKNFTVNKSKPIIEIHFDQFKKDIDFDQNMIIDLAILLGCDYCSSTKGYGPIKSFKLISEYKTLENIFKHHQMPLPKTYIDARNYFKNPPILIYLDSIKNNSIQFDKLTKFLKSFGYDDTYISNLSNIN
jgi:flap endonuclease-1